MTQEPQDAGTDRRRGAETYCFAVDQRPLCVWGRDLRSDNLEFLGQVDPTYFAYLAEAFADDLAGEEDKHAALAIRMAYSQGLEALFALLCASVQAPGCIAGWLLSYRVVELEAVVRGINRGEPILNDINLERIDWRCVAEHIYRFIPRDPPDRRSRIIVSFAACWQRMAFDFLHEHMRDEYNSIKHGFRVKSGGFTFRFGEEPAYGVAPPPEAMKTLASSKYGSHYPFAVQIQGDRTNILLRPRSRNWSPADMAKGLSLICVSMQNVIGCLRIINGAAPGSVEFSWLDDDAEYLAPWSNQPSMSDLTFDTNPLPESAIPIKSKDVVLKVIADRQPPTAAS